MSLQHPILIIGQGISGTMLSWMLSKSNIPHHVIDHYKPNSPSRIAAGIINPVTGRRIVKTWLIDELLPFAESTYRDVAQFLGIDIIAKKSILDYFPTQQMKDAFEERLHEEADYLFPAVENIDQHLLLNNLGYGTIAPCFIINIKLLIDEYKKRLLQNNQLSEAIFDECFMQLTDDGINYKNKTYSKVIYANGIAASNSKYWRHLPFAPNKGEAIIIEAPMLDENFIYKRGITIAPLGDGFFWVGSNYEWEYKDEEPTALYKEQLLHQLEEILKTPFKFVEHKAGIRPANIERRPFVGFHPQYPAIGILSGMGAKGTSLSPYFAHQLAEHILRNSAIHPEADVGRFAKILSRNN